MLDPTLDAALDAVLSMRRSPFGHLLMRPAAVARARRSPSGQRHATTMLILLSAFWLLHGLHALTRWLYGSRMLSRPLVIVPRTLRPPLTPLRF